MRFDRRALIARHDCVLVEGLEIVTADGTGGPRIDCKLQLTLINSAKLHD